MPHPSARAPGLAMLELEQGTNRLVWTQGMTRTRWVTLKLGLLVAAALLVALATTALLKWWRTPCRRPPELSRRGARVGYGPAVHSGTGQRRGVCHDPLPSH